MKYTLLQQEVTAAEDAVMNVREKIYLKKYLQLINVRDVN
jgi:hypothetical protein